MPLDIRWRRHTGEPLVMGEYLVSETRQHSIETCGHYHTHYELWRYRAMRHVSTAAYQGARLCMLASSSTPYFTGIENRFIHPVSTRDTRAFSTFPTPSACRTVNAMLVRWRYGRGNICNDLQRLFNSAWYQVASREIDSKHHPTRTQILARMRRKYRHESGE